MEKEKVMDDLISRQAAIDAIKENMPDELAATASDLKIGYTCGMAQACVVLKGMPSAQPEWIPWKEYDRRLQDHYYYLVTHIDYGTPMKAKYHDDPPRFEIIGGQTADVYFESELITAWMPLPEPYKENE